MGIKDIKWKIAIPVGVTVLGLVISAVVIAVVLIQQKRQLVDYTHL